MGIVKDKWIQYSRQGDTMANVHITRGYMDNFVIVVADLYRPSGRLRYGIFCACLPNTIAAAYPRYADTLRAIQAAMPTTPGTRYAAYQQLVQAADFYVRGQIIS